MKRIILCVAVACALVAVSAEARGDTIYDNGSYRPDTTGVYSDANSVQICADDFTLTSSATVTGIEFWGLYWQTGAPGALDDFTVVFYGEDGGLPDNDNVIATFYLGELTGTKVHDNASIPGFNVYAYQANLAATAFAAGTYFVSIYNDTTADPAMANNAYLGWIWNGTSPTGWRAYQWVPNPEWGGNSWGDLAFNLTGTWGSPVPEPATLVLLGLGVAGVAIRRRRQS